MRLMVLLFVLLSGCHWHASVPNEAADFDALGLGRPDTPAEIDAASRRFPAARLPAILAVVRLQGRTPCVINVRNVEGEGDLARLSILPHVRSIVPLSDIVCPGPVSTLDIVREAAASVRADLVLVYTFATVSTSETTIPLLGTLTLGIFPNELARATSSASAALVDTRTGYIYGLSEATAREYRITNAWNTWTAQQKSEEGAQRRACRDLVKEVELLWVGVLDRSARGVPSPE